jgi:hypothetical protein
MKDGRKEDAAPLQRNKRDIKLTEKAQESGLNLTGEPSPVNSSQRRNCSNHNSPSAAQPTPPSKNTKTPKMRQNHEQPRATQPLRDYPVFSRGTFLIYSWEWPFPVDFLRLNEAQKAWKRRTDQAQQAADFDDGSDDWYEFSGDEDKSTVARTFVNRAKRAFWAGKSWEEFVQAERAAYNDATASAKCAIFLSNEFRMQVFDHLKERLCNEIWLEEYRDTPGVVVLPVNQSASSSHARNDSKMATPAPPPSAPGGAYTLPCGRQCLSPTTPEKARGIKVWCLDDWGHWEPFYEGETVAPNGISNMLQDFRKDRERERQLREQRQQQQPAQAGGSSQAGPSSRRREPAFSRTGDPKRDYGMNAITPEEIGRLSFEQLLARQDLADEETESRELFGNEEL